MLRGMFMAGFITCGGLLLAIPSVATAGCTSTSITDGVAFDCDGDLLLAEDADVLPEVRIEFVHSGGMLDVTLIYQGASSASTSLDTVLTHPSQILTGVLFTVADPNVVLTALDAVIDAGSVLTEGVSDPGNTLPSIAGQWAAKGRREGRRGAIVGDIQAGSCGVFDFAVGCVGDIMATGADEDEANHTQGKRDVIDDDTNLGRRRQPGGADFCIVPPNAFIDLGLRSFDVKGPLVQNAVTISYEVGDVALNVADIGDVTPLFGTDGLSFSGCCL